MFLFFDELKQKASIYSIPFTLHYGLITSIPTEWKMLLRNQNNCSPMVIPTLATHHDPPSTWTAYSLLLNKAISPPTSENRILNFRFTKKNIHKVYAFPFLITKDSKLIAFQYNITHRILPTKSSLFQVGITESNTVLYIMQNWKTNNHSFSWWHLKYKHVITLTECVNQEKKHIINTQRNKFHPLLSTLRIVVIVKLWAL